MIAAQQYPFRTSTSPTTLLFCDVSKLLDESGHHTRFCDLITLVQRHEKAVANVVTAQRSSPLLLCCLFGKDDYIALLLYRGAQPNVRDSRGRTPLMLAAASGSLRAISLLLKFGAVVEATDDNGDNALLFAASRLQTDAVEILITEGGANINARSTLGYTALTHAAVNGSLQLVQFLVAHGAHHAVTYDGDSVINLATGRGYPAIAAWLSENLLQRRNS